DDDANGQIDDIHGWDFVGNDAMMTDLTGHGTQVTGVICMRGNNTIGSAGVCWEAQAMIIKDGNSVPQLAAAAAGIEYATMNGAAVCNLSASFGAGVFPLLQSAIGVAQASGMIVCVAAGNAGNNLDLVGNVPATYTNDNIVVVAASTSQDQHASFSNFGASTVDVHAPGVSIYTTDFNTQTSFSYVGGTSFSAPIVTGCLALMRAHNPGADHGTVIAALLGSVDSIPALAGSTVSSGRVNLHQALVAIGVSVGAPTPDPMSFVMPPILLTESVVRMVASPALPGPVEYRFDLVAGSGSGGNSSSWQSTSTHLDTGLLANTQFSYQVRARNATTLAETAPSMPSSIWTPARAPSSVTIASLSNTSVTVGTIAAASNPPTTEYALEFDGLFPDLQGQLNPTRTWAVATVWDGVVISGLSAGSTHTLRARARNGAGIATADSSLQTLTTSWLSACAAGAVGTAVGGPFDVFSINGSSGGPTRSLTLTVGSPIPTLIATPPTSSVPVNHALFGWIGIPGSGHEFPISPSVGTLCFLPCGPASFVVWTTFGPSPCGSMIPATPTPFSVVNPGYPFSLPPITFQALVEESPGIVRIANALVLRYQ
ncbi:MAG: S8 family serine peptidase, partial [Planctomycetes bacterium]|nr:S8 family serine peptidase [Planctomycetota bacterium]